MFRADFYPTPKGLAGKMVSMIKGTPIKILEPSAGKGDLIECLQKRFDSHNYGRIDVSAIEIDEDLQATLRGKDIKVIDTDFLNFNGPDKFDVIIANPPFNEGDKHLLKAIDIMYCGQIIFLLNAETIKNPFTNTRKELTKKLSDLKADIEYIPNAFKDAERPTGVEVALINIIIDRQIEDDLFQDVDNAPDQHFEKVSGESTEVSNRRAVEELVTEYNQIISIGQETILNYFRNYRKIGKYIGLDRDPEKYEPSEENLTTKVQNHVNCMVKSVRTDFWRRTLELPEVTKRFTKKKHEEFEHAIKDRCNMDFTTRNIRQFVLNLLGSYEKTLTDAVLEVFDRFTMRHAWHEELETDNIHYFNGWKTNKAYRVNRRIIIPVYGSYDKAFNDSYSGQWKLNWSAAESLRDIDIVMNYFDGLGHYTSISKALEEAFSRGQSSKIESTYFTLTAYKKGTLHLTFNDEDILRRFNIVACKGKSWLPHDYGTKAYQDLPEEEKTVAESFEGEKSYTKNLNRPLFAASSPNMLQLTS